MNYRSTHDFRGKRPRVIATWETLGAYFEDVQAAYPTLNPEHQHDTPAIKELLMPDAKITEKLERFRMKLNTTEFVKTSKQVQTIGEGALDVGLYLDGAPECFIKTVKLHGSDIRIVYSPEVHVTSNPDALYLRGAAILSLIDSLESQGNRVELWLGWDNTVGMKKNEHYQYAHYESRILVKRAQDYATPAQLAGVMCDSRFLGTCEFNMISHFLNTRDVGHNSGLTLEGDVTIDGRYDNMSQFDSVESTLAWVEDVKAKLAKGEKAKF